MRRADSTGVAEPDRSNRGLKRNDRKSGDRAPKRSTASSAQPVGFQRQRHGYEGDRRGQAAPGSNDRCQTKRPKQQSRDAGSLIPARHCDEQRNQPTGPERRSYGSHGRHGAEKGRQQAGDDRGCKARGRQHHADHPLLAQTRGRIDDRRMHQTITSGSGGGKQLTSSGRGQTQLDVLSVAAWADSLLLVLNLAPSV